jgi:hypothetical protein
MAKKIASKQTKTEVAHLDDSHPVNLNIRHNHHRQVAFLLAKFILVDLVLIVSGILIYSGSHSTKAHFAPEAVGNVLLVVGLVSVCTSVLYALVIGCISLYKRHVLKLANSKHASEAVDNGLSATSAL